MSYVLPIPSPGGGVLGTGVGLCVADCEGDDAGDLPELCGDAAEQAESAKAVETTTTASAREVNIFRVCAPNLGRSMKNCALLERPV